MRFGRPIHRERRGGARPQRRRRCLRERKRNNGTSGASGGSSGKKIALLLPEHTTARYETQDRPHFESMVKSLCPDLLGRL